MAWLFTIPFLILLGSVLFFLPYESLRLARRNTYRSDGRQSEARRHRAFRHGSKFAWRVLLAPLLVMLLTVGGMRAFHLYVMPDATLADLFGENHPEVSLHATDLEAWEEALEAKRLEEAHLAWRQAQGIDPAEDPSLQQQFAEHWPMHLVFLLLLCAFALWYGLHVVPQAVATYRKSVLARAREYLHRDLTSALAENDPAQGGGINTPSNR